MVQDGYKDLKNTIKELKKERDEISAEIEKIDGDLEDSNCEEQYNEYQVWLKICRNVEKELKRRRKR